MNFSQRRQTRVKNRLTQLLWGKRKERGRLRPILLLLLPARRSSSLLRQRKKYWKRFRPKRWNSLQIYWKKPLKRA